MADMEEQDRDREAEVLFGYQNSNYKEKDGASDFGEGEEKSPEAPSEGDKPEVKTEAVGNMPFDEAVNVDGSESVESDQEEEGAAPQPSAVQVQAQKKAVPQGPLQAVTKATGGAQTELKDEGEGSGEGSGDEARGFSGGPDKAAAGAGVPANAYNPMDYANLKVSTEISELFQYISRYHPHNIELDTKLKPFIPEYIPAVGEVDAFLKVPRPDGVEETLGLTCLV